MKKIDSLNSGGHIRTGTKDMAHAPRILGNDIAHRNITEALTEEDATDVLIIAKLISTTSR